MGDPKFPRKRFETPSHPWQADRIAAEKTLVKKYGLKNKREVWKASSSLRRIRTTARKLLAKQKRPTGQQQQEVGQLLARLARYGIVRENSSLDDVLALNVENMLTRRLQTQVYLHGLAGTPRQARQFITHGHIFVGERKVTIPSYLVAKGEEEALVFNPVSTVADEGHPVRAKAAAAPPSAEKPRRTGPPERRRRESPAEGTPADAVPAGEPEPAEPTAQPAVEPTAPAEAPAEAPAGKPRKEKKPKTEGGEP